MDLKENDTSINSIIVWDKTLLSNISAFFNAAGENGYYTPDPASDDHFCQSQVSKHICKENRCKKEKLKYAYSF